MKLETSAPRLCPILAVLAVLTLVRANAQSVPAPPAYGPFNVHSIAGGIGITEPMAAHDSLALSGSGWALTLWVKPDRPNQTALLAGVGRPLETFPRFLGLHNGIPFFWAGGPHALNSSAPLTAGTW